MDKKTFAQFLVVSALVLISWWGLNLLFFAPRQEPQRGQPVRPEQPAPVQAEEPSPETPPAPEAPPTPPVPEEDPAQEAVAEPPEPEPQTTPAEETPEVVEDLELNNQHLSTRWTNVGAALRSLTLLDEDHRAPYKVDDKRPPLVLLQEFQDGIYSDTVTTVTLAGRRNGRTWTVDLPADQLVYEVLEQSPDRLVFQAPLTSPEDHHLLLRKTVTPGDGYHYNVELEVENASEEPLTVSFALRGPAGIERESLDTRYLGTRVGIEESPGKYDVADRSAGGLNNPDEDPNKSTSIRWAGSVNHYFAAVTMLAETGWVDMVESRAVIEQDIVHARGRWNTPSVRRMTDRRKAAKNGMVVIDMVPQELAPGEAMNRPYKMVAAPKEEEILEVYDAGLRKVVDLGLLPALSRIALVLLNAVHTVVPNYGLAILVLTAFVRLILHPLTRKSQLSFAKMQKLQPQIAELQKQYSDDKEKLAQEQMQLWRKYGVSPLSGCGPLLLQMPVLIALFGALRAAIELRHAGFLWVADLSQPDTLFYLPFELPLLGDQFNLLPIIMAVVMMLNQKYMSPPAASEQAAQQQKIMKWFPLFFVFILYRFPSGLCLYLTCSTTIGLMERWLIQRKADEIELKPVGAGEKKKQRRSETLAQQKGKKKAGWLEKLQKLAEEQTQARSDKDKK